MTFDNEMRDPVGIRARLTYRPHYRCETALIIDLLTVNLIAAKQLLNCSLIWVLHDSFILTGEYNHFPKVLFTSHKNNSCMS